ncbi:MAG: glycosyltransferase family 2 protein [Clostridia bacterium]|nr:glycosyltransferase family 2 protein [Clostridia bacterium]
MEKDLISVIVPCYNVGKYLDDCLESLAQQTYENYEVICVNDGSKDNTLDVIKAFCETHEKFRFVDQQNRGLSGARNSGIAVAKGKYLCFVDSDDLVAPEYIETLHSTLTTSNADISCCRFIRVKDEFKYKNFKPKKEKEKILSFEGTEDILVQLLSCKLLCFSVWNKLYKREYLEKIESFPYVFDEKVLFWEDISFNIKYFQFCKTAVYSSKKLYLYRKRGGSLMRSRFNERMLTLFRGLDAGVEICKDTLPIATQYVNATICCASLEMLFRMFHARYQNSQNVVEMYKRAKATLKDLRKSKKVHWFKQLHPLSVGLLRVLMNKHFRRVKKQAKSKNGGKS